MAAKGVYLYEYRDDEDKFKETLLPGEEPLVKS